MDAYEKAPTSSIEEDGEVEIREFTWGSYQVHWEKFLEMFWDEDKGHFEGNTILTRLNQRKSLTAKDLPKASDEVRQMALAVHYKGLGVKAYPTGTTARTKETSFTQPKKHIGYADSLLYIGNDDEIEDRFSERKQQYEELKGADPEDLPKDKMGRYTTLEGILFKVVNNWKSWKKDITEDRAFRNRVDRIASEDATLLRQTPGDMIFVAVDGNDRLIAFLIPNAVQDAFQHASWVKSRMEVDTKHFYTHIKQPHLDDDDKRHISEPSTPSRKYDHVGSDHHGIWHAPGHGPTVAGMVETSDSLGAGAIARQALFHYLEGTGGTMTKLLDFWFGVWDPDLREEYRQVYREAPKYARLPPTNEDPPELYTLRVNVINRDTDYHKDDKDWVGGLTGLIELGKFKGKPASPFNNRIYSHNTGGMMCLNELGLRLDGYQSGAMLLFRGAEIYHYVSPWNVTEGYRYAFDHTSHQSVRTSVLDKKPYPPYKQPRFSKDEGGDSGDSDVGNEEDYTLPEPDTGAKSKDTKATGKGKAAKGKSKGAESKRRNEGDPADPKATKGAQGKGRESKAATTKHEEKADSTVSKPTRATRSKNKTAAGTADEIKAELERLEREAVARHKKTKSSNAGNEETPNSPKSTESAKGKGAKSNSNDKGATNDADETESSPTTSAVKAESATGSDQSEIEEDGHSKRRAGASRWLESTRQDLKHKRVESTGDDNSEPSTKRRKPNSQIGDEIEGTAASSSSTEHASLKNSSEESDRESGNNEFETSTKPTGDIDEDKEEIAASSSQPSSSSRRSTRVSKMSSEKSDRESGNDESEPSAKPTGDIGEDKEGIAASSSQQSSSSRRSTRNSKTFSDRSIESVEE